MPSWREAAADEPRIRLYVEAERSGKVAAVNFGIARATLPIVVIVSGDVLPEPGAIGAVAGALDEPGVGLAGGRPVPVNRRGTPIGHAVHLLWRLHHRLALHQPKLGEMIALRAEAVVLLPAPRSTRPASRPCSRRPGWRSRYVPEAVVGQPGPGHACRLRPPAPPDPHRAPVAAPPPALLGAQPAPRAPAAASSVATIRPSPGVRRRDR